MLYNNEFDTFATKCPRHSQPLRYVLFKKNILNSDKQTFEKLKKSTMESNIHFACDTCPVKRYQKIVKHLP